MIFKCLPLALSALVGALVMAAADAVGPHLMVQAGTIALDPIADQTHGSMKWSHGAFLYADMGPGGIPATFSTLDREGRLLSSVTAAVPDSAYVPLVGFDRQDDNSIVFIAQAFSAYGQPAPFIGLISADGRTQRLIRTAPYYPNMLSIAPDGTFWTVGYEMVNHKTSAPELDPDAGVLRHFDRAGKLLGSTDPQSDFVKAHATRRLSAGYIAATHDRIGWYAPTWGRGGQYTEIDLDSMTPHSYPGLPDLPPESRVLAFSLTESGNAYLFLADRSPKRLTTFMFDRAVLKWVPIKGPATSESPGSHLIGVDGEQLVFQSWSSAMFFSLSH